MKPHVATYVANITSFNRRAGQARGNFLFPLNKANVWSPHQATTTVRAVGGYVPLKANPEISDLNEVVRIVIDNLPTAPQQFVYPQGQRFVHTVARVDFRERLTDYARVVAGDQPPIQLMPGVRLPDLRVYLLDSNDNFYEPALDWHVFLQFDADQGAQSESIMYAMN